MLQTVTLTLLSALSLPSSTEADLCGGAPCLVLGPCITGPITDWTWTSQQIDGQRASNIANAAQTKAGKDININCPGTTTATGGSGQ
jgi:hypothetical protein